MGIEGLENLSEGSSEEVQKDQQTTSDAVTPPVTPSDKFPNAGRDEEIADQRKAELDEAREEHNRRTGGGEHPTSSERG